jgi:predicted small secreted protein
MKIALILLSLMVAACSNTVAGVDADSKNVKKDLAKFIYPEGYKDDGAISSKPLKSYCYKTLGAVDCYINPQKGQESRLVPRNYN